MDILTYREYEGTAELDMTRGVCRGKILFIGDLVTYEAESPAHLQAEFERAVDDYIETCRSLGREPQKPLRGQFNVRIPPEMHKDAWLRAHRDNMKLNEVIVRALSGYLYGYEVHQHNVSVTMELPHEMQPRVAASTGMTHWESYRAN